MGLTISTGCTNKVSKSKLTVPTPSRPTDESTTVIESHRVFLVNELMTDSINHKQGRDFYSHLKGTHDLLLKWGNSYEVCLAGLFHSIYGTMRFRHQCVPLKNRSDIENLIGTDAEYLAYAFCVLDRPKVLLQNATFQGTARPYKI